MPFLSTLKREVKHELMPRTGAEPTRLSTWLVRKAEYLGASYVAGRVNTQFGDRAKFRGVEITYGLGLLGMAASLASDVFGLGWSSPALSNVSTAFVGAHLAARGAADGMAASGQQLSLASGTARKTVAGHHSQVLGEIPPAPQPGKYLDLEKVARVAAMHG